MTTILAFVVANAEWQITCESLGSAVLEMIDLKDMDCDGIKAYVITGETNACWQACDEIESILRDGKPFGRKGMAAIASDLGVEIKLHGLRAMTSLALGMT